MGGLCRFLATGDVCCLMKLDHIKFVIVFIVY